MKKFKTIIVGVDFSRYSLNAAKQAVLLAQKSGARLVLAHYYDDSTLIYDAASHSKSTAAMKIKYAAEIKKRYAQDWPGAQIIVKPGKPELELVKLGKKYPGSLIVVGHKGMGAVERFLLGSVAERLSLTSPVPVWIHVGSKAQIPKKFLIPCDVSDSPTGLLDRVSGLDIAKDFQKDIFYVFTPVPPLLDYADWSKIEGTLIENTSKKLSQIHKRYPSFSIKSSQGEPAAEILKTEKKYDVVILSPRHKKPWLPVLGRVATKVVRQTRKPVLIFP